jgi:hypothetical protein
MPITPTQALQMLQTNTEAFLNRYPIRIFGDPSGSSAQANYRIEDATASLPAGSVPQRPGSVLRHLHQHDTQLFFIKAGASAGPNVAGSAWLVAHSVKMWDAGKAHQVQPYTLPAVGGPSLMVTGELTGCSFAIHDNNNGSLVVTHIKPHLLAPGEHAGAVLRAQPLQTSLQNNPYWDVVYGGKDYDTGNRRVAIIGCRTGTTWKIYAQKLENAMPFTIRKVKKIF